MNHDTGHEKGVLTFDIRNLVKLMEGVIFHLCQMSRPDPIIILICIFLLSSCSKEKETLQTITSQKTGLYKIELSPKGATRNNLISVSVKGANPSDLSYQWIVNDVEIEEATEDVLRYPQLKKNDRVQVKVSIKGYGELISEPLIISNTIPKIESAKLLPENPKKGDELKVKAKAFDGDGDTVSLLYEWFINGASLGETSDSINIDGKTINRGDKISVKIIPTDGEQRGQPVILYSIVTNSPPRVLPGIEAKFEGLVYKSKIIAEDPEGDPLTYIIKEGPEGMTIDLKNGAITWRVTPKDKGEHNIIVSVSDDHGGEILVRFTTRIKF